MLYSNCNYYTLDIYVVISYYVATNDGHILHKIAVLFVAYHMTQIHLPKFFIEKKTGLLFKFIRVLTSIGFSFARGLVPSRRKM